jgi:hypothetical protein
MVQRRDIGAAQRPIIEIARTGDAEVVRRPKDAQPRAADAVKIGNVSPVKPSAATTSLTGCGKRRVAGNIIS